MLLARASFRLRYEKWKRDRKIQAIQSKVAAALEAEQLKSLARTIHRRVSQYANSDLQSLFE